MLKGVVLTPDEWTPESGLVTPAMKVQRVAVGVAFKEEIEVGVLVFFLSFFVVFDGFLLVESLVKNLEYGILRGEEREDGCARIRVLTVMINGKEAYILWSRFDGL